MKFLLLMSPASAAHFIFTVMKELGCENELTIYFEDFSGDRDKYYKSIADMPNCRVINISKAQPPILGHFEISSAVSLVDKKLGKEIRDMLASVNGEDWFVVCDHNYERMSPLLQIKKAAPCYKNGKL